MTAKILIAIGTLLFIGSFVGLIAGVLRFATMNESAGIGVVPVGLLIALLVGAPAGAVIACVGFYKLYRDSRRKNRQINGM